MSRAKQLLNNKPQKPLTPEQRRLIRQCADAGETWQSTWHKLRDMGYKGSNNVESLFRQREQRMAQARERGPLILAAISIEDKTADLMVAVLDAFGTIDEENPRKVRELIQTSLQLESAYSEGKGGPAYLEGRLGEAIDMLELYDKASDLKARFLELYPEEPDDEKDDDAT